MKKSSQLSAAQTAIVQSPSQFAPNRMEIKIKSLSYKELKDGKHQIIVNWGFDGGGGIEFDGGGGIEFEGGGGIEFDGGGGIEFDGGGGIEFDGGGGIEITVTKLTIDVELTDAKGFKQKVTRTLTNQSPGSGSVSITPIPIPKDPMVGVPITDLFRGNIDPRDPPAHVLKYKVTLTATAISSESTRRILSGQKSKEGTMKVIR